MNLKPNENDRRKALRILSEGVQFKTGYWVHSNDLVSISWAHMILNMVIKDLEKYEDNEKKSFTSKE